MPREAKVRILKKYPNRRLYDTRDSAYVTLEDAMSGAADVIVLPGAACCRSSPSRRARDTSRC